MAPTETTLVRAFESVILDIVNAHWNSDRSSQNQDAFTVQALRADIAHRLDKMAALNFLKDQSRSSGNEFERAISTLEDHGYLNWESIIKITPLGKQRLTKIDLKSAWDVLERKYNTNTHINGFETLSDDITSDRITVKNLTLQEVERDPLDTSGGRTNKRGIYEIMLPETIDFLDWAAQNFDLKVSNHQAKQFTILSYTKQNAEGKNDQHYYASGSRDGWKGAPRLRSALAVMKLFMDSSDNSPKGFTYKQIEEQVIPSLVSNIRRDTDRNRRMAKEKQHLPANIYDLFAMNLLEKAEDRFFITDIGRAVFKELIFGVFENSELNLICFDKCDKMPTDMAHTASASTTPRPTPSKGTWINSREAWTKLHFEHVTDEPAPPGIDFSTSDEMKALREAEAPIIKKNRENREKTAASLSENVDDPINQKSDTEVLFTDRVSGLTSRQTPREI